MFLLMFVAVYVYVTLYATLGPGSPLSGHAFFALFAVLSGAALWFWGLLLIAALFHPIHGWMRVDRPGLLPRVVQLVLRWPASFLLGLLFLFPFLSLYLYVCLY